MHETKPTVYLIARPSVDVDGIRAYLTAVGGTSWLQRRLHDAAHEEAAVPDTDEDAALLHTHEDAAVLDPTLPAPDDQRPTPLGRAGHQATDQAAAPPDATQPRAPREGQTAHRAPQAGGQSDAQLLIEFAGRVCYRSWEPGLNPNVTRVRTDQREYFENLLRSAHGSVLEHASYSFALHDVSRAFTHELVRHRAGSAFSQESLRYVRLTDIGFRLPPALQGLRQRALSIVEQLEEFQVEAAGALGIEGPSVPFHVKKEVTSALRRLAPIGLSTDIVWTANVRTLRHVIEMRTAEGAEEELRLVFDEIAKIMVDEAPSLFQDFARQHNGAWVPKHSKV